MGYKLLVLAPSAGGKSTLTRYLREYSDLNIAETDEEVVRANNVEWPPSGKDKELVQQTAIKIISRDNVVYMMKDMPRDLLLLARKQDFMVVILDLAHTQLLERNKRRMAEEGYDDASQWFAGQLQELNAYVAENLVDEQIDGNLPVAEIAAMIVGLSADMEKVRG